MYLEMDGFSPARAVVLLHAAGPQEMFAEFDSVQVQFQDDKCRHRRNRASWFLGSTSLSWENEGALFLEVSESFSNFQMQKFSIMPMSPPDWQPLITKTASFHCDMIMRNKLMGISSRPKRSLLETIGLESPSAGYRVFQTKHKEKL